MMRVIRKVLVGVYAALALAVLGFGTAEALTRLPTACDEFGQIGTCPPFTNQSCDEECKELFDSGGTCTPEGCCQCAVIP